jgi:hypothetical protein
MCDLRRLATWRARASSGNVQGDDDYRNQEDGDCGWRNRADPVEARRGRGWWDRDVQAHARQDFPGELAVEGVGPGGVAKGVRDGNGREGSSCDPGCAGDDPGGERASAWPPRGGVSAGAIERQVGEHGGQLVPGAGAQGVLGSLLELLGCEPAGLEGLAQLA